MAAAAEVCSWTKLPSISSPRVYSSLCELEGKLYCIGGCDSKGIPGDIVQMYDPGSNTWSALKSMGLKRAQPSVVAHGKQIIVIGGIGTKQEPLAITQSYHIDEGKWSTMTSMPQALLGTSAVLQDNSVFLIGGQLGTFNPTDQCLKYDISNNAWAKLASMKTCRYAAGTIHINNKLYVLGGRQGKLAINSCEVYSISTNKWEKLPNLMNKRIFPRFTSIGDVIYSLGGIAIEHNHDSAEHKLTMDPMSCLEIMDTSKATCKWRAKQQMNAPRADFAIGVFADKQIAVAGGSDGNIERASLETSELYNPASNTWQQLPNMPSGCTSASDIMLTNNTLIVVGGIGPAGPTEEVMALNQTSI